MFRFNLAKRKTKSLPYCNENNIDEKILERAYIEICQKRMYTNIINTVEKKLGIVHSSSSIPTNYKPPKINATELRQLVYYDKKTGLFTNLQIGKYNKKVGSNIKGTINKDGYVQIYADGKRYYAHILAYLYVKGQYPYCFVDHRNGIKNDNRWKNLRLANYQESVRNRKVNKNNKTGYKGVYFNKKTKKYVAQITIDYKGINLGSYFSAEEAHKVYCREAAKHFGEYACIDERARNA